MACLRQGCSTDVCFVQDKSVIQDGVCKLVPSLKHAKVVQDWVGLRPYREPVRLQLEHHQVMLARQQHTSGSVSVSINALKADHCMHISSCDPCLFEQTSFCCSCVSVSSLLCLVANIYLGSKHLSR